jgi:hypothetical protein
MAEFAVYNGGNVEFREIAVMVRDASADQGTWPLQIVERSLSKAEASNPYTTFRGRLIRQARLALLEYINQMEPRAAS